MVEQVMRNKIGIASEMLPWQSIVKSRVVL